MERDQIAAIRASLNLSQEGLARLLGVSVQTVRRWEHGLSRPLPIIAARLDELLRTAPGTDANRKEDTMRDQVRGGDRGAADLGFGGLLKGMGSLLDFVSDLNDEGGAERRGSGSVNLGDRRVKGVYGFTIRTGLGGRPVVEQFGNIRQTERGARVGDTLEPLVDLLDEGEVLRVVVEVPGVDEQDIDIEVQEAVLTVSAATGSRKYFKEVKLPWTPEAQSLRSSFRNGLLEVVLSPKEDEQ